MTIKIEQAAVITVPNTTMASISYHPYPPLQPPLAGSHLPIAAELPSLAPCEAVLRKHAGDDICPDLELLDSDEDCISLSSFGSDFSSGGRINDRRVSFAAPLVTEVKTRPRTQECDKRMLFYTQSETDRFRQVYREERQAATSPNSLDKEPPSSEDSGRRRISRVVVEHNDSLETFYDSNDLASLSVQKEGASMDDVFFDNDSFWSGSITWY